MDGFSTTLAESSKTNGSDMARLYVNQMSAEKIPIAANAAKYRKYAGNGSIDKSVAELSAFAVGAGY
jgi:hypothetical protein